MTQDRVLCFKKRSVHDLNLIGGIFKSKRPLFSRHIFKLFYNFDKSPSVERVPCNLHNFVCFCSGRRHREPSSREIVELRFECRVAVTSTYCRSHLKEGFKVESRGRRLFLSN